MSASPSETRPTARRTALARIVRLVHRGPALVAAAAVLITIAMLVVSGQGQVATNTDGMAPDNPQVRAAVTLGERFGDDTEEVLQILVRGDAGGLVGADGLAAAASIETAVRQSDAAPLLADTPDRPAVVTWLFPTQLAPTGPPGSTPTDDEVVAAYEAGLAGLPAETAGLAAGLLPDGSTAADAGRALVLVFLDPSSLPSDEVERWEAMSAAQVSVVDHLRAADLPAGVSAAAFSSHLLFAGGDDFDTELTRMFAGAFACILLILGFVYWVRPGRGLDRMRSARRSAADVALTLGAIVMAIVWMQGAAVLLGPGHLGVIGPISQFAQVIPVLLIGLGVDYAIHLTSRYREEVGANASVAVGMAHAMRTVGSALALATVATAVGFLTNLVNPIPDLQDFGVLAAIGIVSAFVLMLTFVPAVRLLLDRRAERAGRLPVSALGHTSKRFLPSLMAHTAVLARRAPLSTLAATMILAGLGVFGLTQLEVRFSNTDAVPDDSPVLATLETIADDFGGGFAETTEVLLSGDLATPAAHNALVEAHRNLAQIADVVQRGGRPAADSIVTVVEHVLAADPNDPAVSEAAAAVRAADVGADLTVPSDADVAVLYRALAAAMPDVVDTVIADAGQGHDVARVVLMTSAGEEGGGELSAALTGAFAPLETAGVSAVATSQPILVDVIVQAMRDSQVSSLGITLLVVMLLLVGYFARRQRHPFLGVITVAPVVLVVLWTFGLMALTGIPFGPITATIAALAIGIGLPYAIHVTHRFVEDRRAIADVGEAITATVRHTGGAMAGSAFTTIAGFGILTTSSLLPFRHLGLVTVYAVACSLLAATLVQPSLLVLWSRWHANHAPDQERPTMTAPPRPHPTIASDSGGHAPAPDGSRELQGAPLTSMLDAQEPARDTTSPRRRVQP